MQTVTASAQGMVSQANKRREGEKEREKPGTVQLRIKILRSETVSNLQSVNFAARQHYQEVENFC